jgi:hypothetical protein
VRDRVLTTINLDINSGKVEYIQYHGDMAEDEARKKIDALLTSAGLSRLINGDGRVLTMVGIPDPEEVSAVVSTKP